MWKNIDRKGDTEETQKTELSRVKKVEWRTRVSIPVPLAC